MPPQHRTAEQVGASHPKPARAVTVFEVDLTPVGAQRRNWKQTLIGDGYVVVRHPDLQPLLHMADRLAREVQLFAG